MTDRNTPIANVKNIGPKSAVWLEEAGIRSLQELEKIGPIEAYERVRALGSPASLNLVYAMQAAILNIHLADLPPEMRDGLRSEVANRR